MAEEPKRPREQTPAERFTAAYQELSPRVLGYLRSHGVDDAEAVTNDVFLALHQKFDRITGGDEGVRTLTFSIAHARIVDHQRSRAIRPPAVLYDPESDLRRSPSAENIAIGNLGDRGVLAVLQTLGEEQREAVSLRVIAGLSLEETADVMGKSVGAVKQLQRRALESLRSSVSAGAWHD